MRSRALIVALALAPLPAAADLLTVWAAGKADYLGGTGGVFTNFDSPFGGGVEAGVEVLGIDVFGEALIMGADQYFFSANLGIDFAFGDETRVILGIFTGPVFFVFPEQTAETGGLNFDRLPADQRARLESLVGSLAKVEAEYNKYAEQEADVGRLAAGWNLGRLRLNIEHQLATPLYIGLGGQLGYHYILTGEAAAADTKSKAVDEMAREYGLDRELREHVRDLVGAEEVDTNDLDGLNFSAGIYLKFEL